MKQEEGFICSCGVSAQFQQSGSVSSGQGVCVLARHLLVIWLLLELGERGLGGDWQLCSMIST